MPSIAFIVMRRLRAPLIGLIAVYAITILGLTVIPGVDAQGLPTAPMSFFHAMYFVTYTATTIGFGEIPVPFSDGQRFWVTFCVYLVVIGWSYTIIVLVALLQDRAFQHAMALRRFQRRVRALREPFYLVCGCGETGAMVCRALDRLDRRFVVVEINETRIQELELEDFRTDVPAIAGDARLAPLLELAGLARPSCVAVLALTNDDAANLAVAMAVRLINPDAQVLCRVYSPQVAANMASFGTDHMIDPFTTFAGYLALAMRAPGSYRLLDWLTALPGSGLRAEQSPPRGNWVVCGYGRFGRAITAELQTEGLAATIVDPEPPPGVTLANVRGVGTEAEPLLQAGLARAVGLVAGTDNDIDNLSIAVTAREINPRLYVVARQNLAANAPLFSRLGADLTMVPSEIVAHECLAILTAPLLSRFLAIVRGKDDAWADEVIERLRECVGDEIPATWSVRIDAAGAPAVHAALVRERVPVTVGLLMTDPSDRTARMPCRALLLRRGAAERLLPGDDDPVQPGDEILFAGAPQAASRQSLALGNANALLYLRTGEDPAGGWLWARLGLGRRA